MTLDPPTALPADVRAAALALDGVVRRTPVLASAELSRALGREVVLKAEHLQVTGSFKARGAFTCIGGLDAAARARGVVTVSAGNHAAAVAWAAREAGVEATVVMPVTAPRPKLEACRAFGATVLLEPDVFRALDRCMALRDEQGLTLVHPFDDPGILAGAGTVALELVDDLPRLEAVVVPVGGGGLIAGIARVLAALAPGVSVYGVEPEGADGMSRSLAAGAPVRLDRVDTVADGLGAPMAGALTYPVVRDHVREVVRSPDAEIVAGLRHLLERERQVVEPAGAAGVGALLAGRVVPPGAGTVAVVVSGGNLDLDTLGTLFEGVG